MFVDVNKQNIWNCEKNKHLNIFLLLFVEVLRHWQFECLNFWKFGNLENTIIIWNFGILKLWFVFVLTQGGPSNATQVLGTYIYLQAFNLLHMGYANALSVILLVIALILGWLQLKASRKA